MRPPTTPPGPSTAPGRRGTTRGLRKRGGLPLTPEPGEGGGCSLEARGREEESRPKRRMVAQAPGREEAAGDQPGETPAASRPQRAKGSGHLSPRAAEEASSRGHPTPSLFPQLPPSLLYC